MPEAARSALSDVLAQKDAAALAAIAKNRGVSRELGLQLAALLECYGERAVLAAAQKRFRSPQAKAALRSLQLITDALYELGVGERICFDLSETRGLSYYTGMRFCILAHVYTGKRESNPHDHGPSWAIYGQARGETVMSDWAVLERTSEGKPGKVRRDRTYTLTPGMAHVYNEGDVHSPRRDGPTRLIRIEGTNMDKVKRPPYEVAV